MCEVAFTCQSKVFAFPPKQRNECRKNKFKELKIEIKKRERERGEKENSTKLQKPYREAEVYNNNKKCDWGKKKEKNPKESTEQVKK